MKDETIEDLFSNSGPFEEAEVVKTIKPYVTIHSESFQIFIKNVEKLNTENKILLYGLAKKLLVFRNHIESEGITASEFHKKTGIKKGSIDPGFKKLRESGLLIGSKGEYVIPNLRVPEILSMLKS